MKIRFVLSLVAFFGTPLWSSMEAVAQSPAFTASIHSGECEDLGETVATLPNLVTTSSDPVGSAAAVPAANSFATIPLSLDAMLASDHALIVERLGSGPVACGAIGGIPTSDKALVIGISEAERSGSFGIAYLRPNPAPSQTDVSIFVAFEPDVESRVESQIESSAQDESVDPNSQVGELTPAPEDIGNASTGQRDQSSTDTTGATDLPQVDAPTSIPTERPLPTPTPVPLGATVDNPAPLGTTLESQGLAVTVNSAYFDYGFAGAIPRGGYKVLILGVTIENVSENNRGYTASRFSAIDPTTGNIYDPVTLEDVGVLLTNGDLQPGEFVSGTALVEVQETATNVIIKYDVDYLGDEDLYWS